MRSNILPLCGLRRVAAINAERVDNAFSEIDNLKAQQLADQLPRYKWRRLLDALAKPLNPLLKGCAKAIPITGSLIKDAR